MAVQIRKAERSQAKLRLGMSGPSGSGKTYSSLVLGLALGKKVGLIDTEHGSGDLYAHLGDYDIIQIEAPFTTVKYLEALRAFEDAAYDVVIIDSLTHAWAGEGGLLDKQGKIADADPRGNSYTAWRKVTPDHNALVEAMLASPCHLVATVRAKQDYAQEKNDKGNTVIKKLGMAPVQREGMEYEFTVFLDLSMEHTATASKDRTSLFDGEFFKIDRRVAKRLLDWLNIGKPAEPKPAAKLENADDHGANAEEVSAAQRIQLANALDDAVSDYQLGFVECGTLPDLAAHFDKAQKHVRAQVKVLGAETVKPFLDRLIASKDTRKTAIEQANNSTAGQADPNKLSIEDVKKLESLGAAEGLTPAEVCEACNVKALADLQKSQYADCTDAIVKAGRAKKAAAKPARTKKERQPA